MAESADLDPELLQSLELFNAHLETTASDEKAARIVAKAERRKDEAAARVRKLNDNPKASADEKAEAEAAYRAAVAELAARTEDPFGTTEAPTDTTPEPQPETPAEPGPEAEPTPEPEAATSAAEPGSKTGEDDANQDPPSGDPPSEGDGE